ncbi:PQQ-dependent sugar dehydrogenase [Muricauda sp. CAU 1633]|uniref:PQQ-dependent sugar dehydrogenase n=1 Tax=Allomuricauda sp. CAU 1633 TaxID=2816036 RepID=UPI001A8C990B|nr:PQQ-dependent sugar dehydrogenase [Muricauda sp. CAU 1633]MBO0322308.1 PQQ-dependent sugar dehydrogenase [Muricauda sp. CAU 1633]
MKDNLVGAAALWLLVLLISCRGENPKLAFESEEENFALEMVTDSIRVPFGMCFLPNHQMLVTNRFSGEIIRIDLASGTKKVLKGIPKSYCRGDGGALDILPHPEYEKNGWLYFAHSIGDSIASTMAIERGKLKGDSLSQIERIFTALPYYSSPSHYGMRMAIKEGYLFFTMGDRYDLKDSAQTLNNHLGKVMRIFDDGRIPNDNPFVGTANARHEIWSYGHRNPQGLTLNPNTQELWLHEHGPKGGDEVNHIKPGLNYGWPIICHGIDYDDTPIGEGITHAEGMEQPNHYYVPSIAPSGMEFYSGNAFKKWKGSLFIGAMAKTHLNRLVLKNGKIIHEERLLEDFGKRIRVVRQGPDGHLYIGVDGGAIYKLIPN